MKSAVHEKSFQKREKLLHTFVGKLLIGAFRGHDSNFPKYLLLFGRDCIMTKEFLRVLNADKLEKNNS